MIVNDPIADMLTRIRNAIMAGHTHVSIPTSRMKEAIARILEEQGFIEKYDVAESNGNPQAVLRLKLRYVGVRRERRPVITGLERVSKPGRRVYSGKDDIPWVLSGMGIAILTTPQGVMTGQQARQMGVGGEVLCKIW